MNIKVLNTNPLKSLWEKIEPIVLYPIFAGAELGIERVKEQDPQMYRDLGRMFEHGDDLGLDRIEYKVFERIWRQSGYCSKRYQLRRTHTSIR